jgi:hypothetical protein
LSICGTTLGVQDKIVTFLKFQFFFA